MCKVIIITDHKGTFITVLNPLTDLKKWALKWIKNNDQDIEFWQRGNIFINRNTNEIDISGDNGLITLDFKTFEI